MVPSTINEELIIASNLANPREQIPSRENMFFQMTAGFKLIIASNLANPREQIQSRENMVVVL